MPTVIIDQSETAAQIAKMSFTANTTLVVQRDAGTPSGDAVSVDLSSLASYANFTAITVTGGATVILGNIPAGSAAPVLTVNGGIMEVKPGSSGNYDTINVGPQSGLIRVDNSGLNLVVNVPVVFTNGVVPANFELDFPGVTSVNVNYTSASNTTTVQASLAGLVGRTVTLTGNTFNVAPNTNVTYSTSDGSGGTLVCFLPGSLIETPRGEVAVEALQAGDDVVALEDGVRIARRLVWTGSRTVTPAGDRDAMPIRIRRDALADGVPHTDLLVTPEHCLLLDGRLVPARMLVNDRSIVIETGLQSFVVHHVETEPHAIILANGATTESYLDTGNRATMRSGRGVVLRFPTPAKTWAQDGAAPLGVERAFVEPLWRALDARAEAAGLVAAPNLPTTEDADLKLLTATGRRIAPLYVRHDKAVFLVPGSLAEARLLSRTARPSDTVGPFVDDRRPLGVLVGTVSVSGTGWRRGVQSHLSAEDLPGWHACEAAEARWTDGDALLPLIPDASSATLLVEVQILGGGPYTLPTPRPAIAA